MSNASENGQAETPLAVSLPDIAALEGFDVRRSYQILNGFVPEGVERRWALAEKLGRLATAHAFEAVRALAITDNPLGLKTQQIVQFAQLLVLQRREATLSHGRAALRAGATLEELLGAAETALVTSGVGGYGLGVSVIAELAGETAQAAP